jgi:hypothetical protein
MIGRPAGVFGAPAGCRPASDTLPTRLGAAVERLISLYTHETIRQLTRNVLNTT